MWDFWEFSFFKEGVGRTYVHLFPHPCAPRNADMMAGRLATIWKRVTEDGKTGSWDPVEPSLRGMLHYGPRGRFCAHVGNKLFSCSCCHYLGLSVTCSQTQSKLRVLNVLCKSEFFFKVRKFTY